MEAASGVLNRRLINPNAQESGNCPTAAGIAWANTAGGDPEFYFHGGLDDLRFYGRALNASELQALVDEPDNFVPSGG